MSASTPKRHHYIAQMLLRRFTDKNGKLFFFNKRFPGKGVLPSTPGNLFCEANLYTAKDKDGAIDVQLERDYAELESLANPIIEKIVTSARRGQEPHLTDRERETWDIFFCSQWMRVPDVREKVFDQENIKSRLSRLIAVFEAHARPLTSSEASDLQDPAWVERVKQNAMIDALKRPSPQILKILKQKGMCIAVIRKPGKSFVIGSLPIAKLAYRGREHIAEPTVEMWLPIAFDVAVSPAIIPSGNELLREIRDDSIVRRINGAIFRESTVIAGISKRLIASLSHSR